MAIHWFCVGCLKDIEGQREYFGQELCQSCAAAKGGTHGAIESTDGAPLHKGEASADNAESVFKVLGVSDYIGNVKPESGHQTD